MPLTPSRPRVDPVQVDAVVGVLLLAAAELEIWLTSDAASYRLATALTAPVLAACVAVRRRRPFLAGVVAQGVVAGTFAIWGDTQIFGNSIAWFCALYGLTAWTSRREFAIGTAFVAVTNLAAAAGPKGTLPKSVPFTVVTLVVMLLVRVVLGDRGGGSGSRSASATSPLARPSSRNGRGSRASSTTRSRTTSP